MVPRIRRWRLYIVLATCSLTVISLFSITNKERIISNDINILPMQMPSKAVRDHNDNDMAPNSEYQGMQRMNVAISAGDSYVIAKSKSKNVDNEHGKGVESVAKSYSTEDDETDKVEKEKRVLETLPAASGQDKPKPLERKQGQQKLVILTYMRSGSTLSGDFFQQHPGVFYIFEPLWMVEKLYTNNGRVHYLNGSSMILPGNKDFWSADSISVEAMRNVLGCQFQSLDIQTLSIPHWIMSKCTRAYCKCVKRNKISMPSSAEAITPCLDLLIPQCSKAPVIAIKTIRFKMEQIEQILNTDPDVKVIHLIRDPRGTLSSQRKVGEFAWKDLAFKAASVCDRMLDDLRKSISISKAHPGRILTVRYEDIAQFPLAAAESMYEFVGLEMTNKLRNYIWSITYSGQPDNCNVCTIRSNATDTANKWRTKLRFPYAKTIDDHCSLLYDTMGYRIIKDYKDFKSLDSTFRLEDFGKDLKVLKFKHLQSFNKRQVGSKN